MQGAFWCWDRAGPPGAAGHAGALVNRLPGRATKGASGHTSKLTQGHEWASRGLPRSPGQIPTPSVPPSRRAAVFVGSGLLEGRGRLSVSARTERTPGLSGSAARAAAGSKGSIHSPDPAGLCLGPQPTCKHVWAAPPAGEDEEPGAAGTDVRGVGACGTHHPRFCVFLN